MVVVVFLDWVVVDGDGIEVGASFGLVVVWLYAASRKAERRGSAGYRAIIIANYWSRVSWCGSA